MIICYLHFSFQKESAFYSTAYKNILTTFIKIKPSALSGMWPSQDSTLIWLDKQNSMWLTFDHIEKICLLKKLLKAHII